MNKTNHIVPNSLYTFCAEQGDIQSRIDQFITKQFPYYSRSFFQRLIKEGRITLNGNIISKPSIPLQFNDSITIQFPAKPSFEAKVLENDLGVEVIHEHEQFLIIFKPAHLLIHPPSLRSTETTLIDWIVCNYKDIANVGCIDRPGIIHRLDKDTSGVLIIPRTNYAHTTFGTLFKERKVEKTYYALVQGHPQKSGSINLPIGRDPISKTKMIATEKPINSKMRNALTHYNVIEYFDDCSLVEVKPVTGRTHQIRVHLAAIGHPIIGDQVYGNASKLIKRQALHAHTLAFEFNGTRYTFSKELPHDLSNVISYVRKTKQNIC